MIALIWLISFCTAADTPACMPAYLHTYDAIRAPSLLFLSFPCVGNGFYPTKRTGVYGSLSDRDARGKGRDMWNTG